MLSLYDTSDNFLGICRMLLFKIFFKFFEIEHAAEAVVEHAELEKSELEERIQNERNQFDKQLEDHTQKELNDIHKGLNRQMDEILARQNRKNQTAIEELKKDFEENAYCVSFESFAYINLGYTDYKELGPGEIVYVTPESVETVSPACEKMRICSFLWVYYGYPTSSYEGVGVEEMRYNCGKLLAQRDDHSIDVDIVAGVPDSGIAHAIGYANESGIPYARPFIKYTPTWPRSFMPTTQSQRNLIARMKLIPVHSLIEDRSLLLIDDSIVRGTQLRETTEFLYQSGAKEVHVRPACPPLLYGCKYLNFSRSKSDLDLITRRIIREWEGDNDVNVLSEYADPNSDRYAAMLEEIRKRQNFTSLRYHRLDDLIKSIGIDACQVCTYCFNGVE